MKTKLTILLLLGFAIAGHAQNMKTGLLQTNFSLGKKDNQFNEKTFGLSFIQNNHKQSSYRFGLQYNNSVNTGNNSYPSSSQSNTYMVDFFVNSLAIDFGKEYRNFITNNIYMYAGADAYLGTNYRSVYSYSYIKDTVTNNTNTVYRNPILMNSLIIGIKPFVGIRANFGRASLGYQLNTNVYFTKGSGDVKSLINLRGIGVQQNVTLGYRLWN
jgi:hypothetical protein